MYTSIYTDETPLFIEQFANTVEMRRLRDVGMHCGVEYANFSVFQQQKMLYSRFTHSLGVSKIVWNFTHDIKQAVSGLLHDIATPIFAHTIDFLHGDHLTQESTEDKTLLIIENSKEIGKLLNEYHISVEEVADYHIYPIADNDTPMLSADRLEYTIGNGFCIYQMDIGSLINIYKDLVIAKNENGIAELCFKSTNSAKQFTEMSLRNSRFFVSNEDRFAMQYLADTIKVAIERGILTHNDFYLTETEAIKKLKSDKTTYDLWDRYVGISSVTTSIEKPKYQYSVNVSAKKRFIDPLVLIDNNTKRLSDIDCSFKEQLQSFIDLDFNKWIYAV